MRQLSVFLVTGLLAWSLQAATVYRWIDESGVVSFSDVLPETRSSEPVEQLEIHVDGGVPDPSVAERRSQMTELANRLAADRRERELSRQAPVQAEPVNTVVIEQRHYATVYGRPLRFRGPPGFRGPHGKVPGFEGRERLRPNLPRQSFPTATRKWAVNQ